MRNQIFKNCTTYSYAAKRSFRVNSPLGWRVYLTGRSVLIKMFLQLRTTNFTNISPFRYLHRYQLFPRPSCLVPQPSEQGNCHGSWVCVTKVNETLSRLVTLQAKQKPRVLYRNKRYVVPHKRDSEWRTFFNDPCSKWVCPWRTSFPSSGINVLCFCKKRTVCVCT